MIPLPKPGKDPEQSKSYRPIALLSPIAKLIERILLPELDLYLEFKNHQHGFRKERSTTTALNCIVNRTKTGLNNKKPCDRTLLVALDLTAAFDTVDHQLLLDDVVSSNLSNNTKRWIASYHQGRQTYVEFRDKKSKNPSVGKSNKVSHRGGGVSCHRHSSICTCPSCHYRPATYKIVSYADDITIAISGPVLENLASEMNSYLAKLHQWLCSRNLSLSAEKSTTSVFTTWSAEQKRAKWPCERKAASQGKSSQDSWCNVRQPADFQ